MKSLGKFPDPFIAEISGQPAALRRAAEGLQVQTEALTEAAAIVSGRTIVFTGMGSSYDACYPAVTELADAGVPAVMLDAAELLHFRSGMLGAGTVLVAVSQSGESAEVVRAIERARDAGSTTAVVSVTNGVDNSLVEQSDVALDTQAGPETGPSTMTFAASLVVLAALARAMGGRATRQVVDDLGPAAELASASLERVLGAEGLADELVGWLGDRTTFVILGRGPARAAAEMGALTIKEAVGIPIESLETAQFRHGPLELAGPDLAALVIATEPETASLDLRLARELAEAGAAVLTVTASAEDPLPSVTDIAIGALDRTLAPSVAVLPAQLLAWRLSGLRGREPGAYYVASKVTTRE
jgi:glutamine---fructose-6-phosphate transaminase (isomerizing)